MGIKRCKLPRKLQLRLLENFVLQVTARSAADVHGIQANTVALFYRKIRLVIAEKLEAEAVPFAGEIEVDESYFGGVRKGPRGRGAAGKVPVFGLLKRGGKVYALPTTDTREKTLLPIIRRAIIASTALRLTSRPSCGSSLICDPWPFPSPPLSLGGPPARPASACIAAVSASSPVTSAPTRATLHAGSPSSRNSHSCKASPESSKSA